MKRIVIAVILLTMAASGCSKPTTVGGKLKGGSSKIASPTPTPSTPKPKPTKSKVKTVAPDPGYKGRDYPIQVKDLSGYDPANLRVYVGDRIVFTNNDPNQKHTFTGNESEWDSGELSKGQTFTYKVTLAPGKYFFHCELVPYITGGPVEVLKAPV